MPKPVATGPFLVCQKSGRIVGFKSRSRLLTWLFPLVGFIALLWYLIRVLPKPGRATYPCQKVAAPLAWSFLGYLLAFPATVLAFRKARRSLGRAQYWLAAAFFLVAVVGAVIGLKSTSQDAQAGFTHSDPPNSPIGTGKGIYPGRVAWAFAPGAVSWNSSGNWWDDAYNDQAAIDRMVSLAVRSVSGRGTDAEAWDRVFRSFNQRHGKGDVAYAAGEKIAIKINMNNTSSHANNNNINASPHMVLALLKQLVNQAAVAQSNITVFDASRFITDNVYAKCHAQFPDVVFVDNIGGGGRVQSAYYSNAIPYSIDHNLVRGLATCVVDANYVINLALLKGHSGQGVTFCGKNYYGTTSIYSDWTRNNHDGFNQNQSGTPTYMMFADFLGHKDLGEKTMLFMIDALYGCSTVSGQPTPKWRMAPFNYAWPASLFVSEDGVAVDSVAIDFFTTEFPTAVDLPYCDRYLHEAALANSGSASANYSGTVYDPERDGTPCGSLGVHEHWNDATHRQYTRNLGGTNGIELVSLYVPPTNFIMNGTLDSSGYQIATNGTRKLFASVHGTTLYVAAPFFGNDQFIFVTDVLDSLKPAPLDKSGMVAFDATVKPYLIEKGTTGAITWSNGLSAARCAAGTFGAGCMEGTIDLVQVFGAMPQTLYLAFAPYGTDSGGGLNSGSQVPAGNGNGDVESNEFLAVPVSALRDTDLVGVFDILDPGRGFVVQSLMRLTDGYTITWPSVPGHVYQVLTNEDLRLQFQPLATNLVAASGQFNMTCTDTMAGAAAQRFYRVQHIGQ